MSLEGGPLTGQAVSGVKVARARTGWVCAEQEKAHGAGLRRCALADRLVIVVKLL
jgi:hypothetical protein